VEKAMVFSRAIGQAKLPQAIEAALVRYARDTCFFFLSGFLFCVRFLFFSLSCFLL
jgi:hypothetical protein